MMPADHPMLVAVVQAAGLVETLQGDSGLYRGQLLSGPVSFLEKSDACNLKDGEQTGREQRYTLPT